eukprot:gene4612-4821_t
MARWIAPLMAVARAEFFDGVYTLVEIPDSDCYDSSSVCYEATPSPTPSFVKTLGVSMLQKKLYEFLVR